MEVSKMWKRRNGSRVKSNENFSDVSSTATSIDSNDRDEVIGVMGSSKSTMIVLAKSPQIQFQNNETQNANMKETIKYLQHQLDIATDRIAAFVVEKGELAFTSKDKGLSADAIGHDALNESVNRKLREVQFKSSLETALRNVTAQSVVMLAERRDIQADLEATKAMTETAETKMENVLASSILQRSEIISKLKAIQKLIIFEERKETEIDYTDENYTGDDPTNQGWCMPPLFYCAPKPIEIIPAISTSISEKERYIQFSDYEIFNEMRHLHNLLNRKIEEYNSNATLDAAEIDTLKKLIADNNRKLTKRGVELEVLKGQVEESRSQAAHVATQHAELNAFFVKVKVKLQNDVTDTIALAAAAKLAAERQAEKHIQEKAELRAEFQNSMISLENMIRAGVVETTDDSSPITDSIGPVEITDNSDDDEIDEEDECESEEMEEAN